MDEADERGTDTGAVTIDCDDCAVRGPGCKDCVVSVLLGVPDTLLRDERAALEVLAEAGSGAAAAVGTDSPARAIPELSPDDTPSNRSCPKNSERLLNLRLLFGQG